MSVAVMVNGRMAYTRGFGWLDPDRKRRTTTESVFRLASVSKPVTSSITLRLWEQGKLPLDQDLRPIVPEMPSHFSVTLGQVLSNTSGIRGYKQSGHDPSRVQYRHYPRASGALRLFSVEPLVHPPGTAFHYSTQGFTVAAAAAEAVTGKPFAVLVRELAGKPTGAYSLAVEDRRIPNPHRADLFARVVDENVPVRPDDISWKGGGGGMEASAPDLARWAWAFASGKIVKPETRDRAWTRASIPGQDPASYGLGWAIGAWKGERLVEHSGGQLGARSHLLVLPDRGVVVAVLTNQNLNQPRTLALGLAELALESAGEPGSR